jgi:hypothetical protein
MTLFFVIPFSFAWWRVPYLLLGGMSSFSAERIEYERKQQNTRTYRYTKIETRGRTLPDNTQYMGVSGHGLDCRRMSRPSCPTELDRMLS